MSACFILFYPSIELKFITERFSCRLCFSLGRESCEGRRKVKRNETSDMLKEASYDEKSRLISAFGNEKEILERM